MKLKIYTDGACSGNPGNGGWAAIILDSNDIGNFVDLEQYKPQKWNALIEDKSLSIYMLSLIHI